MDAVSRFYETIKSEMTVTLATAGGGRVSMRAVSPVYYGGDILIFTDSGSLKYRQLTENPGCCIEAGCFFAECTAEMRGATLLAENAPLRAAYCEKFPGAFDEGVEFGGRDDDFVLLRPRLLRGWTTPDGLPAADGIPTVPFEIALG